MDQGDFQMPLLPVDFDINWSLWEDDWNFCSNTTVSSYGNEAAPCASQSFPPAYRNQEYQPFAADDNILCRTSTTELEPTYHSWMNPDLNFSNTLETAGLSAWPLQPFNETDNVAAPFLNVGSHEKKAFPASEFPEWQEANITPTDARGSGNSIAPAAPEKRNETRPMKAPERKSMTDARNGRKKRLECPHRDCNLTFPRKYELERHRKTIHSPNISIVCSVYGCNRISKPFPRLDKFYEHITKHHKGPERFLCILECCRQWPLTRAELVEHLNTQHSLKESRQPNLGDILNALGLPGQFRQGGLILPENGNACPLKFLGCEYSHRPSSNGRRKMEDHLGHHELLERSKGYEMIVVFGIWISSGVATCPICRKEWSRYYEVVFIINHLDEHTADERRKHAVEIAQMFRPYLTGQEKVSVWNRTDRILKWKLDPEFRARDEQSGVLSATSQQPEGNELLPGNATGLQEMGI